MGLGHDDGARGRTMNDAEPKNVHLDNIWKFVRGDMEPSEFARWVYSEPVLEDQLRGTLYLETISADYSNKLAVYDIRKSLEVYAREVSNLRCECIALPDLADLGMGEDASDTALRTLEQRAVRGPPLWWLAAYQCSECGQRWLLAQESRINDVFFLKRLSLEEGEQLFEEEQWPGDFDKFETLLRLGRERGHRWTVVDPLDPLDFSLSGTAADLARERPGIRVSELAELFNLDIPVTKIIAKKAEHEEGVVIDFE